MFTKKQTDDSQPQQPAPIAEDVEPPKAGPDGFLSPEWTRWEWRQAEKRLTGGRRPSEGTLNDLAQLDALLAQTQSMVADMARLKQELQTKIDEASGSADQRSWTMGS